MANAQVLVLVRSSAPLSAEQIQGPIEAAARAAGFTPGPWTFNTQAVPIAAGGTVSSGPWAGDTVSETIPAAGGVLTFNAYRQNLLNGPEPTGAAGWPISTSTVGALLRALPGVSSTRIAFRAPGNFISWDKGIPAPIELTASSPSSGWGMAAGLLAVAGLAWWASKGATARPVLSGMRRRGLRGLSGAERQHAKKAEYLIGKSERHLQAGDYDDAYVTAAAANAEAQWVKDGRLRDESYRALLKARRHMSTR